MNHEPILRYFEYQHLPPHLQFTSQRFYNLAHKIVSTIPSNAERTVALRKLLEAKDAAVRAGLPERKPMASTTSDDQPEAREIIKADIDLDGPPDFL